MLRSLIANMLAGSLTPVISGPCKGIEILHGLIHESHGNYASSVHNYASSVHIYIYRSYVYINISYTYIYWVAQDFYHQ